MKLKQYQPTYCTSTLYVNPCVEFDYDYGVEIATNILRRNKFNKNWYFAMPSTTSRNLLPLRLDEMQCSMDPSLNNLLWTV